MLKHFMKRFTVEASSLEVSDLLTKAKFKMGLKLYGMAERVFKEYVETRDESLSQGYFKFAMILGDSGFASKGDVDYLWKRMHEIYAQPGVKAKDSEDYVKRVLGTICMLSVAKDGRAWLFKDDPEKKKKLADDEIPDATEYFLERK